MSAHNYGKYLHINRQKKQGLGVKSERTYHVVTHNPSTASAGETLNIRIPRLAQNYVIVPNTLKLTFHIVLSGADHNKYIVNNLGRNIITRKVSKIGGTIIRDLNNCYLYDTFCDLWKTTKERRNMSFQGIQSLNLRQLRSKASNADTNISQDNAINQVYGNKYMIPLDFEIYTDHLPFYPFAIPEDFTEDLTFASNENIIISKDTNEWGYKISNICLEYETFYDESLARQINDRYIDGISFLYDHVTHFKTEEIRDATLINININVPKRSLKGALLLFEEKFTDGARDSEKFSNPSISHLDITIEGLVNKIFSHRYKALYQWSECRKHFAPSEEHKHNDNLDIDELQFYGSDKFALWVDLRSTEDVNLHGSGLRLENTKDGIQLAITRNAKENYKMHIFLVADAQINIVGNSLRDVLY
jgi:hypothetical protein